MTITTEPVPQRTRARARVVSINSVLIGTPQLTNKGRTPLQPKRRRGTLRPSPLEPNHGNAKESNNGPAKRVSGKRNITKSSKTATPQSTGCLGSLWISYARLPFVKEVGLAARLHQRTSQISSISSDSEAQPGGYCPDPTYAHRQR
jgi:hypothetical protein